MMPKKNHMLIKTKFACIIAGVYKKSGRKMNLKIGISTCPNDTYIFGPLLNRQIAHNFNFQVILDDVEVLNKLAVNGKLDIVKVSYGVVGKVKDRYSILKSGGALGFGCGPVVVSKNISDIKKLKNKKIAVPGVNTSAFKIFEHFFKPLGNDFVEKRFDMVIPAVLDGDVDAGILIHEGRFVYHKYGLDKLADLGELWEEAYNSPIPLGCILIRNELKGIAHEICELIRNSIRFSQDNSALVEPFIQRYAQELDDEIIKNHIKLFVNEFSSDISEHIDAICKFLVCEKQIFVG